MVPVYTPEQVRKIDEFAIKELGIPSSVLMENAGGASPLLIILI